MRQQAGLLSHRGTSGRGTPHPRASVWSQRQLVRLEQRRQLVPAAHALLLACEGGMAVRGALGRRSGSVEGPRLRAVGHLRPQLEIGRDHLLAARELRQLLTHRGEEGRDEAADEAGLDAGLRVEGVKEVRWRGCCCDRVGGLDAAHCGARVQT